MRVKFNTGPYKTSHSHILSVSPRIHFYYCVCIDWCSTLFRLATSDFVFLFQVFRMATWDTPKIIKIW